MERDDTRTITIPGTATDLADYLGVNRCAQSRTIGHLRETGVITFDRHGDSF